MEPAPYSHLTKGSFLIASPDIDSGVYFRSVLIICEHSSAGSFGLIINKSLEMDLPDEIAIGCMAAHAVFSRIAIAHAAPDIAVHVDAHAVGVSLGEII